MKKIILATAAMLCCMTFTSCNEKPAKQQANQPQQTEQTTGNQPIQTPQPGVQGDGDLKVQKTPDPAKAKENAEAYRKSLDELKARHPDMEDWDVSAVLDSLARAEDPSYSKQTKHMGITWKQMRALRSKQGANAPK